MNRLRFILLLLTLVLAVSLAMAQQSGSSSAKTINMKGMKFDPDSITIKVGEKITWNNNDDRDHTVVDSGGAFKSDNIGPGKSFSFTFTKAGTYTYSCTYHPRMKAKVVVTDK